MPRRFVIVPETSIEAALLTLPLTFSVAPLLTVADMVPLSDPLTTMVPAATLVVPVKELELASVNVPVPALVRLPAPLNDPE